MLEEDEFVLLGEDDLTLALRNNLLELRTKRNGSARWREPMG